MADGSEAPVPRPPEGDWLGTPYARFERHGSIAHCVIDRPDSRNVMTGAMYFAVRYAVDVVNRDDALAGLIITGTDPVFIPGGDLGASLVDDWGTSHLGMDNVPFDAIRNSRKPVISAVNGICQGGGLLIAIMSDIAVASDRATFRAPSCTEASPTPDTPRISPPRSARPAPSSCSSPRCAWTRSRPPTGGSWRRQSPTTT